MYMKWNILLKCMESDIEIYILQSHHYVPTSATILECRII
jgi:hypothetical protein